MSEFVFLSNKVRLTSMESFKWLGLPIEKNQAKVGGNEFSNGLKPNFLVA